MMALWGRILGTVGEAFGGRVIHATLTQAMLERPGRSSTTRTGWWSS